MVRKYNQSNNRIIESKNDDSTILLIINPDDKEKKFLIDELKIDEHTLNSSLDPDELSRIEYEPEHISIICKFPLNYSGKDKFLFKVGSCGIFLFKEKIIIVTIEDIPIFENKNFNKVVSYKDIMLKVLNFFIFHFLEHLKVINMIADEFQDKLNTSMENSYLINLFGLQKSLVYYLNSINSNGVLIEKLKSNIGKIGLSTEEQEYLDDILIENIQCYKQAEIYSNILASSIDARASIVGNNLNSIMKTLTIVTIAIMLPNLVVSIFSMNVEFPLRTHPFAFWFILVIAILSSFFIALVWRFKKK